MAIITLPKGGTIRTFSAPPPDFEPLKADERELALYGFPRRPTEDASMVARWEKIFSGRIRMIEPSFRRMDYKRPRLPKVLETFNTEKGTETTEIWSGAVVHAPANNRFRWIEGTWTVPNAFPPAGAQEGVWYSASTWIGIDGLDPSSDVLQVGCDSNVSQSGSTLQRQLNPWWEWYPEDSYWITNLAVSQGDTMYALISVTEGSTTSAEIFLYNVTSGLGARYQATAPSGISLLGNCAEWIVERLEIDTQTPELARYGDVYFGDANCFTVGGTVMTAGSGNVINMLDSHGRVISAGAIETATLVKVRYTG